MRLASLQRAFQRHVYRPGAAMERHVAARPRAGAARRLGIYSDAYRLRLIEALGIDYPGLRGAMGARSFEALMREFVEASPSLHANLRWYGGELERFLRRSRRWRQRIDLAELARFEWALGLAFDAADASLASERDVSRLPAKQWHRMRLRLHPSVHVLLLRSNAPERWRAGAGGRKLPRTRTRRQALGWLIWRRGHTPRYRPLPADEARALAAAAKGQHFGAICVALRRGAGGATTAARAAQLLKRWLDQGLVCAIE